MSITNKQINYMFGFAWQDAERFDQVAGFEKGHWLEYKRKWAVTLVQKRIWLGHFGQGHWLEWVETLQLFELQVRMTLK